jgi:hypothetical protein
MCRFNFVPGLRAAIYPGIKRLAGKLGQSAAVVASDDKRLIVLVPAAELDPIE